VRACPLHQAMRHTESCRPHHCSGIVKAKVCLCFFLVFAEVPTVGF